MSREQPTDHPKRADATSWLWWITACCLALLCAGATGGAPDPATLWLNANRGAVVQLRVFGKVENKDTQEYGTGFLIRTAEGPRIITAGHVVGPDSKWDSLKERCIYYRLAQFGSSMSFDCVLDANVRTNIDLAEVYLDPFPATTLMFTATPPAKGATLYVASWRSWGQPGSRAVAQAVQLLDLQDNQMILSGNYEGSDSGSPVVDQQGVVVGLLIQASNQPGGGTRGVALSLAHVSQDVSNVVALPVRKSVVPVLGKDDGSLLTDALSVSLEGCVFLGKRSAARATQNPADMPFGLVVLNQLSNEAQRKALIGKELTVRTPVNLRTDCPTVTDGSAYYAPPRARLNAGYGVVAREILALRYLDDTFYWARGVGFSK